MTTKERLIELFRQKDPETDLIAFCIEEFDALADEIIHKLPEWGWSYDAVSSAVSCSTPLSGAVSGASGAVCPDCNGLTAKQGTDGIFRPCHCQSQTVL